MNAIEFLEKFSTYTAPQQKLIREAMTVLLDKDEFESDEAMINEAVTALRASRTDIQTPEDFFANELRQFLQTIKEQRSDFDRTLTDLLSKIPFDKRKRPGEQLRGTTKAYLERLKEIIATFPELIDEQALKKLMLQITAEIEKLPEQKMPEFDKAAKKAAAVSFLRRAFESLYGDTAFKDQPLPDNLDEIKEFFAGSYRFKSVNDNFGTLIARFVVNKWTKHLAVQQTNNESLEYFDYSDETAYESVLTLQQILKNSSFDAEIRKGIKACLDLELISESQLNSELTYALIKEPAESSKPLADNVVQFPGPERRGR